MSKHTSAPWTSHPKETRIEIWSGGMKIAEVVGLADFDFANACLIAAAPELLDALKSVGEFFDTWQIERGPAEDALFAEIDAAIAKAEGAK